MCVVVYIVLRHHTHWSGWDVGAFVKILALIIEKKTCLKLKKINNIIQVVQRPNHLSSWSKQKALNLTIIQISQISLKAH